MTDQATADLEQIDVMLASLSARLHRQQDTSEVYSTPSRMVQNAIDRLLDRRLTLMG